MHTNTVPVRMIVANINVRKISIDNENITDETPNK